MFVVHNTKSALFSIMGFIMKNVVMDTTIRIKKKRLVFIHSQFLSLSISSLCFYTYSSMSNFYNSGKSFEMRFLIAVAILLYPIKCSYFSVIITIFGFLSSKCLFSSSLSLKTWSALFLS